MNINSSHNNNLPQSQSNTKKPNNTSDITKNENNLTNKSNIEPDKNIEPIKKDSSKFETQGHSVFKTEKGTNITVKPKLNEKGEVQMDIGGSISAADAISAAKSGTKFAAENSSKAKDPLSKLFGLK